MAVPGRALKVDGIAGRMVPGPARQPRFQRREDEAPRAPVGIRRTQDQQPSGPQYAIDLAHRVHGSVQVLYYLLEGHAVERLVRKGELVNARLAHGRIKVEHDPRGGQMVHRRVHAGKAHVGPATPEVFQEVTDIASHIEQPAARGSIGPHDVEYETLAILELATPECASHLVDGHGLAIDEKDPRRASSYLRFLRRIHAQGSARTP